MNLEQLSKFHKTKSGYALFGLVELGLSYLFASVAINSGSLWEWLLALIFFLGFLQNVGKLTLKVIHGGKRQTS